MTSIQYRETPGGRTHEIEAAKWSPKQLLLEKRGDYFYMSLSFDENTPQISGGSIRIPLKGNFYVGIGVCSHEKDLVETALFSNVKIGTPQAVAKTKLYSTLETVAIDSTDRRVVFVAPEHFEAPNWSRDGNYLLFNREG